ncbi:DUF2188 domain-containing protein [Ligilactobacillus animalis]|uniref:DUF2188 domain-containing protein n=1 Tax=Ligilactobacillus animalis TaxID=1605 RepID=UPI0026DEE5A9|nr:DUF2188 domain-containing protein [Ligilactobacillus animalis]MDO5882555.1 DUF2188 domain-containing protein [Ligilactobacillus animalis]MDU1488379.1 DUF2188 domain-containing protein [Ligilactobacillus animalis]MDU3187264.1 DUF2188 domain-containing protein [Ligilactobacillus animalis]
MGRNQHVVPNPKGGWDVKGAGAKKSTVHTDTKKAAVDIARNIARNQRTELITHGRDGRIQSRDSHGHDPFPPKG